MPVASVTLVPQPRQVASANVSQRGERGKRILHSSECIAKTPKGVEEVQRRSLKLPPKVRTMLILVDARRPLSELISQGAELGVQDDWLEILEREGLIQEEKRETGLQTVSAENGVAQASGDEFLRFREAKHFMNVSVVDALGIRAFLFTLKLERCATRADLAALSDDYFAAIEKSRGQAQASILAARLRELLEVAPT